MAEFYQTQFQLSYRLENAPSLPRPYGITEFIPYHATINVIYDEKDGVRISSADLRGNRTKKDGTPGNQPANHDWWQFQFESNEVPVFVRELADDALRQVVSWLSI